MLVLAEITNCPVCLAQGGGGSLFSLLPLVLIMALGYVMFVLPQQKKEREYRDLVANLKEKDHVMTSAGIYGVVTGVQRDQERVTIRVDEATGAKIRVAMWAITEVITDEKPGDAASPAKDSKK